MIGYFYCYSGNNRMAKPYNIGEMVRFHRKKARISQLELAKLAGVGKTAVFDLEQGKETARLSTLTKILGALNISLHFKGPLMNLFEREVYEKS